MGDFVLSRTWSGQVCEEIIYPRSVKIKDVNNDKPKKPRFETVEDRIEFNLKRAREKHAQEFNANFSPSSLYSTLTFDDDWEVHTYEEAEKIKKNFIRRLKYAAPDSVIYFYKGRGKGTNRIHFHMVSEGVPQELIEKQWYYGKVKRIEHLRKKNYYNNVDCGQDYTGLANYLFNHWTEEQGGHYYFKTRNAKKPEKDEPIEIEFKYTVHRHPRAPYGYRFVESKATKYGYLYFKYVKKQEEKPNKSKRKKRTD